MDYDLLFLCMQETLIVIVFCDNHIRDQGKARL